MRAKEVICLKTDPISHPVYEIAGLTLTVINIYTDTTIIRICCDSLVHFVCLNFKTQFKARWVQDFHLIGHSIMLRKTLFMNFHSEFAFQTAGWINFGSRALSI